MNCALLILLSNFPYGHDASCPYLTILSTFWVTIILYIIYNSTNPLKNPLFFVNKSIKIKKPALLTSKRAHYKGGIIMKKIVLLFVASSLYGLQTIIN